MTVKDVVVLTRINTNRKPHRFNYRLKSRLKPTKKRVRSMRPDADAGSLPQYINIFFLSVSPIFNE